MTDSSITFPDDIVHYKWEWDPIAAVDFLDPVQLPIELQTLFKKGISRPTLADLQFLSFTKGKIDLMVCPEENGLNFIHALGSAFLGLGIIVITRYLVYKCYVRRKKSNKKKKKNDSPLLSSSVPTVNIFSIGSFQY